MFKYQHPRIGDPDASSEIRQVIAWSVTIWEVAENGDPDRFRQLPDHRLFRLPAAVQTAEHDRQLSARAVRVEICF